MTKMILWLTKFYALYSYYYYSVNGRETSFEFPNGRQYSIHTSKDDPVIQELFSSGIYKHFYISNRVLSKISNYTTFAYVVDPITINENRLNAITVYSDPEGITGFQISMNDTDNGKATISNILGKKGTQSNRILLDSREITSIYLSYNTLSKNCVENLENLILTRIALTNLLGGPTSNQWGGKNGISNCQDFWFTSGEFAGLLIYTDNEHIIGISPVHTLPINQIKFYNMTYPTLESISINFTPVSLDMVISDQLQQPTNATISTTRSHTIFTRDQLTFLHSFRTSNSVRIGQNDELALPEIHGSKLQLGDSKEREDAYTTSQYNGNDLIIGIDTTVSWSYSVIAVPFHITQLDVFVYNASIDNIPWIADLSIVYDGTQVMTTFDSIKQNYSSNPFISMRYNSSMWGYFSGILTSSICYKVVTIPPVYPKMDSISDANHSSFNKSRLIDNSSLDNSSLDMNNSNFYTDFENSTNSNLYLLPTRTLVW